jgi:hypothetical protein
MEETLTKTFTLPNRKVQVKLIKRKGGWLPSNHEASDLFKHSYWRFVVPRRRDNGELVDPLTKEERAFFESPASGLSLKPGDLSIHKKENNYWGSYNMKLDKNIKQLDLSVPTDYIRYKVLLANKDTVAPSAEEQFNKGTYKFMLVEEGWEIEQEAKTASTNTEAYKHFGRMMDSPTKMRDFLNVYNSAKPGTKSVAKNAKKEFLQAELEKLIKGDVSGFISLATDENYDTKLLIFKALQARAIERDGTDYVIPGGGAIGYNLNDVVGYIQNPANNEQVLKIKARIENAQ